MTKDKFAIYITFLLLVGCSINPHYSMNRFSTSETNGSGGAMEAYFTGAQQVAIADDLASSPVPLDAGKLQSANTIGGDAGIAVLDYLDLEVDYALSGPLVGKVKVQLFGESRTNAKALNFSLSLLGGWGINIQSSSLTANNGSERTFWIGSIYSEYELMAGLRVMDPLLVYLGYFRSKYSMDVDMAEIQIDTHGNYNGLHLGVAWYFNSMVLKFNASKTENIYRSKTRYILSSADGLYMGLSFGYTW